MTVSALQTPSVWREFTLETRQLADNVGIYCGEISVLNPKRKITSRNPPKKESFVYIAIIWELLFWPVSLDFKIFGLIV